MEMNFSALSSTPQRGSCTALEDSVPFEVVALGAPFLLVLGSWSLTGAKMGSVKSSSTYTGRWRWCWLRFTWGAEVSMVATGFSRRRWSGGRRKRSRNEESVLSCFLVFLMGLDCLSLCRLDWSVEVKPFHPLLGGGCFFCRLKQDMNWERRIVLGKVEENEACVYYCWRWNYGLEVWNLLRFWFETLHFPL